MNPEVVAFIVGVFTGVLGMVVAAMFGAMVVMYRVAVFARREPAEEAE